MNRPVRTYWRTNSGEFRMLSERYIDMRRFRPTGDRAELPRGSVDPEVIRFEEIDRATSGNYKEMWVGRDSLELAEAPRWPRDAYDYPVPPIHLSLPAQCSWAAATMIRCLDDTDLLFLQMAFETFDDFRAARDRADVDEAIQLANEFRQQYRQLGFSEAQTDRHLENPDWVDPSMLPDWD